MLNGHQAQSRRFIKVQSRYSPSLRITDEDISLAMQDVYDFFFDVNAHLLSKGLDRMDDMVRPAIMSGLLSDMLSASVAKHSRTLTVNRYFNGHPDLVVGGISVAYMLTIQPKP